VACWLFGEDFFAVGAPPSPTRADLGFTVLDASESSDEDEEFNIVERISRIRQETIRKQMEPAKTQQQFYDELRNGVIEEVANEVRKMSGFGQDTIDSLTIFIRNLKK